MSADGRSACGVRKPALLTTRLVVSAKARKETCRTFTRKSRLGLGCCLPAMIDAGIDALYFNRTEEWSNPTGEELRNMTRYFFRNVVQSADVVA